MLELQNVSVIIDNKKILDNINLKFDVFSWGGIHYLLNVLTNVPWNRCINS